MVSKLSEIWSWLFIPDPDPDFLSIPDPGSRGQKGNGSQILIRNTAKTYGSGSGTMLTGMKVDMILKLEHAYWLLADEALGLLLLGRDPHQLGHRVQLHKDAVLAPAAAAAVAVVYSCTGAWLAVSAGWLQLEFKGGGRCVNKRPAKKGDDQSTKYPKRRLA